MENRKYQYLSFLLMVLCVVFSSFEIIDGSKIITWDLYDYTLTSVLYLKDSLLAGEFPLWNPFILSGEAFFSQPAAFVYSPIHFIVAAAPDFMGTYYALQMMMLVLSVVGGFGAYLFFIELKFLPSVAILCGIAYSQTAFGPLLGQPPLVASIAFFPWILRLSLLIIENRGVWNSQLMLKSSLFLGLMLLSSYFATSLYVLLFVIFFVLHVIYCEKKNFERQEVRYIFWNFFVVGFLGIMLSAVYLLPAIFNRFYFFSDLIGDFISPEPRMRGLLVTRDQIVDILRNENILISTLFGLKYLAPGRAMWVIGSGSFLSLLGLWCFAYYKANHYIRFFVIATIVLIFYITGPGGPVFEFVYAFVPVLKNIRYPVFAFFLLQISLLSLAGFLLSSLLSGGNKFFQIKFKYSSYVFSVLALTCFISLFLFDFNFMPLLLVVTTLYLISKWKGLPLFWHQAVPILFGILIVVEILYSVQATGIYSGKAINIIEASSQKKENFNLESRKRKVNQSTNSRSLTVSPFYDFANKQWIVDKELSNHGYSTSDSPLYWYMKEYSFLEKVFLSPKSILEGSLPKRLNFESDANFLEMLAKKIPAKATEGVYVTNLDGSPFLRNTKFVECEIRESSVAPNSFQAQTWSKDKCFLVLSNKYFPGWTVFVNKQKSKLFKVNKLFMGVVLPPGENKVQFMFSPPIFWYGLGVSIFAFVVLVFIGLSAVLWPGAQEVAR